MKRLGTFLIAALATSGAFAQQSSQAGYKTTFVDNGFWDNWFVGVGAGSSFIVGDGAKHSSFWNRQTLTPTIQFGKWYNPFIGGRIKAQYSALHTFFKANDHMQHSKYFSAEADLLWNVTNYLCKYKEDRFYNLIPYAGIGFGYGWDYTIGGKNVGPKQRNITVNGGIINKFRLSKRVDLDIDLSAQLLKERENLDGAGTYDGLAGASASLVFKLGKVGFQEAVLQDQALIDDLNGQINRLRSENAELSKRPVSCPDCPEVKPATTVTEKTVYVPNVVFFRISSATIDKKQEISIFNTAEFLKNNPNAKVKVVAYADRKTGTAAYNLKLSERRAKNVANSLINKYNVNSNRVDVEWKGSSEQPYAINDWNRVAIFIVD